jgi:hypothetical protein
MPSLVTWADQKQLFCIIGPFGDLCLLCIFTTPNSISYYLKCCTFIHSICVQAIFLLLLVEMLLPFISFLHHAFLGLFCEQFSLANIIHITSHYITCTYFLKVFIFCMHHNSCHHYKYQGNLTQST